MWSLQCQYRWMPLQKVLFVNLELLGIPDGQNCGIPRTEYFLTNLKCLMRWKQGKGAKGDALQRRYSASLCKRYPTFRRLVITSFSDGSRRVVLYVTPYSFHRPLGPWRRRNRDSSKPNNETSQNNDYLTRTAIKTQRLASMIFPLLCCLPSYEEAGESRGGFAPCIPNPAAESSDRLHVPVLPTVKLPYCSLSGKLCGPGFVSTRDKKKFCRELTPVVQQRSFPYTALTDWVLIVQTECVYCAVRTGSLNKAVCACLQRVKEKCLQRGTDWVFK